MPKEVARDIWIVDGPEIRFGAPGFKLAHPTRMTIVQLPGGDLWIHSPTAPSELLVRRLEQLGPVSCLIAPNNFHYSWVLEWKMRFPLAGVWGPPGLPARARRTLSQLRPLGDAPDPAWASTLDQFLVRGNVLNEAVEVGLLLSAVVLLMLALKIPAIAGALISGGPQLNAGSAVMGAAGVAAGVAGVGLAARMAGGAVAAGAQRVTAARAAAGAISGGGPSGSPGSPGCAWRTGRAWPGRSGAVEPGRRFGPGAGLGRIGPEPCVELVSIQLGADGRRRRSRSAADQPPQPSPAQTIARARAAPAVAGAPSGVGRPRRPPLPRARRARHGGDAAPPETSPSVTPVRMTVDVGAGRSDGLADRFAAVAAEVVHDHHVAGLEGRDQEGLDIGQEGLAVDRPSNTHGASMRSHRRAAMKVKVFQRPNGALAFGRSPLGHQPRRGAMLVLVQVSSMNTRRFTSMSP